LLRAVPLRSSNRRPFRPEPVPLAVRAELTAAARAEGAWLELVTGTVPVAAVAEVANAANRVLCRDPAYVEELRSWTRGSAMSPGVAGGRPTTGVPASAGGPATEPQDLFPLRPFGERPRAPGKDYEAEPLVAVLGTAGNLATDQLRAGYALERVLLTITDLGLACSMLVAADRGGRPPGSSCGWPSAGTGRRRWCCASGTATPVRATPRRAAAVVMDEPAGARGPSGPLRTGVAPLTPPATSTDAERSGRLRGGTPCVPRCNGHGDHRRSRRVPLSRSTRCGGRRSKLVDARSTWVVVHVYDWRIYGAPGPVGGPGRGRRPRGGRRPRHGGGGRGGHGGPWGERAR
jgi:hypothetical protein